MNLATYLIESVYSKTTLTTIEKKIHSLLIGKGKVDITYLFKKYNINNILIELKYEISKEVELEANVSLSNEIIELFLTARNADDLLEGQSIIHEVIHILDFIKSGGLKKNRTKGYESNVVSYFLDTMEFNQLINAIQYNSKYKNIKKALKETNDFEKMISLIFVNKDIIKELRNHKDFKKALLKRLTREGLIK